MCAGVMHTKLQQVGCLLRLEPNKQAQVGGVQVMSYLLLSVKSLASCSPSRQKGPDSPSDAHTVARYDRGGLSQNTSEHSPPEFVCMTWVIEK